MKQVHNGNSRKREGKKGEGGKEGETVRGKEGKREEGVTEGFETTSCI